MLPSSSSDATEALERLLSTLAQESGESENEDGQAHPLEGISRMILARNREATSDSDDPSGASPGSFLIFQSEPTRPTIFFALPGSRLGGAVVGSDGMPSPMGAFSLSTGLEAALLQGLSRETDGAGAGFMGGSMQAAAEHLLRIVVERSLEEQQRAPTVPPANETIRDSLPRVIVTKEDLMDSTNSKCSICLDEYQAGLRCTRVFCGHLFCTSCIREWLRNANSCPVCRFELATDCQEYELGRKERMKGRMARLKEGELKVMRMPDLKKVMSALRVSADGCLEKSDLLERLKLAERVEVLPDDEEKCVYEEAELRSLEMPLLMNLMERYRIAPVSEDMDEDGERAEILQRFAAAGRMRLPEVQAEPKSADLPETTVPKGDPLTVTKPSSSKPSSAESSIKRKSSIIHPPRTKKSSEVSEAAPSARKSSGSSEAAPNETKPTTPPARKSSTASVAAPSAATPRDRSSSKKESGSRSSRGSASENASSSGASSSGQVRAPPDVRIRPSSAIMRPSSAAGTKS